MTNDTQHVHGEYKVIGGKLVVADVVTDGRTITEVKISGDFFLEPEEAYFDLAPALVGASVTADNGHCADASTRPWPDMVRNWPCTASRLLTSLPSSAGPSARPRTSPTSTGRSSAARCCRPRGMWHSTKCCSKRLPPDAEDRKSTRLNSSHVSISCAVISSKIIITYN